jgi:hypothetical protein
VGSAVFWRAFDTTFWDREGHMYDYATDFIKAELQVGLVSYEKSARKQRGRMKAQAADLAGRLLGGCSNDRECYDGITR